MRSPLRAWLVFAVLTVAVTLCSVPALIGTWVYDDLLLEEPRLRGWAEAAATFGYNSGYYLEDKTDRIESSATYRPIPMLTLIATNSLFGVHPLPHHIISLLAHLLVVALLLHIGRGSDAVARWPALTVAAVFALHPALGEGYHWINGRSDPLAAAALLGFAVLLRRHPRDGSTRAVWTKTVGLTLLCTAGLLSKLPFALAVLALAGAHHLKELPNRPPRTVVTRALPTLLSLLLGASAYLSLSAQSVPQATAGLSAGKFDWQVLWKLPQLMAAGAETLLVPAARPMRSLAWELSKSVTPLQVFAGLLACSLVAVLVYRRHYPALVLCGGSALALTPVIVVSLCQWQGFDRYLYLPACLLAVAACDLLADTRWPSGLPGRFAGLVTILVLFYLAGQSFAGAQYYASYDKFIQSILKARPDDPTGYSFAELFFEARGDSNLARTVLLQRPRQALPPPLAHAIAASELRLGMKRAAAETAEACYARYRSYPPIQLDVLPLLFAQGRFDEALELAQGLLKTPLRDATLKELRDDLTSGLLPERINQRVRGLIEQAKASQ